MMDNGVEIDGIVVSDKFKILKSNIERDIKPQVIYSQFIDRGSELFTKYA